MFIRAHASAAFCFCLPSFGAHQVLTCVHYTAICKKWLESVLESTRLAFFGPLDPGWKPVAESAGLASRRTTRSSCHGMAGLLVMWGLFQPNAFNHGQILT